MWRVMAVIACFVARLHALPRIAVIGAGIGGASTIHWLHLSGIDHVDLFESGPVGGRMAGIEIDGREFEAGGSIIHPDNRYMKEWASEFGLRQRDSPPGVDRLGIWNGKEFVFEESSWRLLTLYRLLRRYGFDIVRMKTFVDEMLARFAAVYKLQNAGDSFDTVDELIATIAPSFSSLLKQSFADVLATKFDSRFVHEMVAAIIRCNYGQSVADVHGFVGSVGLAGAVPDLWSVDGGNRRVPESLVNTSRANLITARIASVSRDSTGRFVLVDSARNTTWKDYDAVVLAVPLNQETAIRVDDVDLASHTGQYEQIYATFVQGEPRAATWSRSADSLPDSVLSCESTLGYNSIGQICPVDYRKGEPFPFTGTARVWKVFSSEALDDTQLSTFFSQIREVKQVRWLAYPKYSALPSARPSFILAHHVYHVNAIEWAASAMEMSAIGGRNVANLIVRDFAITRERREKAREREL